MRNKAPRRRHRDQGFTLIEVLVAFAILAVSLAALTGAFSTAFRGIEKSGRFEAATLLARSALEQVGISIPVVPGEIARDAGNGFVLRLRIAPTSAAPTLSLANRIIVPYEVTAVVEWSSGVMSLTTLRLALENDADATTRRSTQTNIRAGSSP